MVYKAQVLWVVFGIHLCRQGHFSFIVLRVADEDQQAEALLSNSVNNTYASVFYYYFDNSYVLF